MRKPARSNPARRQTASSASVPAPTGGWDTESPLADMPARNAVILDNWIPRAGYVEIRRGYSQQVSGFEGPVESLIAYRGSASGDKIFACAGADIYDATTRGPLGSSVYTASGSTTSARWRSTNFANDGGAWALAVNGVNDPIKYDGSSFSVTTISGSSGSVSLDPKTLLDVMSHKRRLFFIEGGSLRVWFLDTNAIAGPAGLLDLGPIFYKGGQLIAEATWSMDGGQGVDDFAVFITTQGQVAVYQGTDPTDANNWALVGVYDLARPIGGRCLIKWGADLAVLTVDGLVPLSQALALDRAQDDLVAITAKIRTAFSKAALSYGAYYGWQAILYPGEGSLAIINVPTAVDDSGVPTSAVQFVQSMQTGGWCRFKGIPSICWEYANDRIYFGGEDAVFEWNAGATDNGEIIVGDVKPAFSAFGNRLRQKQFTMIRALMKAPSVIRPALEVNVDYREAVPTAQATVVAPGDLDPTADADDTRYDWTGATGIGYVGTPRMRVSLSSSEDSDRIAVVSTLADLLIDETGGDHIITRQALPLDVTVQLIGFDLMYQTGGQL